MSTHVPEPSSFFDLFMEKIALKFDEFPLLQYNWNVCGMSAQVFVMDLLQNKKDTPPWILHYMVDLCEFVTIPDNVVSALLSHQKLFVFDKKRLSQLMQETHGGDDQLIVMCVCSFTCS